MYGQTEMPILLHPRSAEYSRVGNKLFLISWSCEAGWQKSIFPALPRKNSRGHLESI